MEKLGSVVNLSVSGLGQGACVARLVKRVGNIAMYERGGSIWEVFIVQEQKEHETVIGNRKIVFEHKELYPSDESFGMTAWCYTSLKNSNVRFEKLLEEAGLVPVDEVLS